MQGSEVQIALPGKFEKWPIAIWSSHPGIAWHATETSGTVKATIAADVPLGVHYVRFTTDLAVSPLLRFVVGDLPEGIEAEPNDFFHTPNRITASSLTMNGALQKSGDVDHFGLDLKQGQRWWLAVAANRSLRSPMDACLQILDARGNVLAQNLDHFGLDPALNWICPKDGAYIVRIFAFPESPDSTIGYSGGDAYRYRLRSVMGEDSTWEAGFKEGALAIDEPNDRSMPIVWDQQLAIQADTFRATVAGTLRVPSAIHSHSQDATAHGMCQLLSSAHGVCLLLSSAPEKSLLLSQVSLPRPDPKRFGESGNRSAFFGRMDARGDEDAVQLETRAPGHWKVQLRARELGSPMDAVLEILDASGKSLAKQGDSGEVRDPTLVNQMRDPGKYTVVIKDLHERFGRDVQYRLEFDDEVPSVKGTLASDLLVGEVGKPIEVEITLDRTFECAEDVTISMAGLPDFIVCEPVASKSGDESAKTTLLKVLATGACSVPIRIEVQPASHRLDAGVVLATNTQRPDLWLLVTAAK
jgi:hypothetical protein